MRRNRGFTLIEITIVVGIIAIIAAFAIPQLLRSNVSANETMAIATLTSLRTAQAEFQQACIVDQNNNGIGEYGFLQELAGGVVPRGGSSARTPGEFLEQSLGCVDSNGIATKNGYNFLIYLPTNMVARSEGQLTAGVGMAMYAATQETRWCCYAWPASLGQTGNRGFCVNQSGVVYQTLNTLPSQMYSGTTKIPSPLAAFIAVPGGPAITNLGGRFPRLGTTETGADGGIWLPAN